jgi:hypothetical protein
MSVHQLRRVRPAAVASGWLHYEPGRKRVPSRYWITVPQTCADIDDLPTDEGDDSTDLCERLRDETGECASAGASKAHRNGIASASKAHRKRSPFIPIPEPDPVPKEKRARAAFVKPTVAEVRAYAEEIHAKIDPQAFVDYYESNGWKVGRNPMRDWKATVRTWNSRQPEFADRSKRGGPDFSGLQQFLADGGRANDT